MAIRIAARKLFTHHPARILAEHDKQIARWKIGHISRIRNEYVHAGDNGDDLRVIAQYLRMLLSRHVNYLLFHAPQGESHGHWLEIVDLPGDEAVLTARKSVIDLRIALIRQGQERKAAPKHED